jgi:hypothetical protein
MKGTRIWNFAFVLFNHALCLSSWQSALKKEDINCGWIFFFPSSLICKLKGARGREREREREALHTVSFSQPKTCQFSELASLNL